MKRTFEELCKERINLESILLEQSPQLHLGWIGLLYKKYKIGDWNKTVPKASSLDDKTYLMWDNESYCLFHKEHKKFGQEIIECAHPYAENIFVFFDYSILQSAFDSLDNNENLPCVPTYYAYPEDRYDYQTGSHLW